MMIPSQWTTSGRDIADKHLEDNKRHVTLCNIMCVKIKDDDCEKSIGPSDDNTTDDVTIVIIVQYTVGEHSLIITYTQ